MLGKFLGYVQTIASTAQASRSLGILQAIDYVLIKREWKMAGRHSYQLRSKHARYPLACRTNTSDREVFRQIFVDREYRCLDEVTDADLIVDCGANCGFSAAYFLSRYPRSFIIAVEPDSENFRALEANLKPYGDRSRAVKSGIWSHATGLVVEDNSDFGDGREWARTVREVHPGEEPHLQAVDVGQLLDESGHQRISILKMDIEGSERVVFGDGSPDWIDRVDNMVIELHGEECSNVVHAAMRDRGFSVSRCDELTVFTRRQHLA